MKDVLFLFFVNLTLLHFVPIFCSYSGGLIQIQREGVTWPEMGSDVWKFCTGSVSLSAEHSENVVKVRFSKDLNVFCYPYACTCDNMLFLALSLKQLNFKSGWITALEHGITFSNS